MTGDDDLKRFDTREIGIDVGRIQDYLKEAENGCQYLPALSLADKIEAMGSELVSNMSPTPVGAGFTRAFDALYTAGIYISKGDLPDEDDVLLCWAIVELARRAPDELADMPNGLWEEEDVSDQRTIDILAKLGAPEL